MREIISVDVVRATYLMQLYILMLKLSTKVYFLKEQQIYKKKESKAQVQIVGKLIVVTAIYLKLMNITKDLKSLLI